MQYFVFPARACVYSGFSIEEAEKAAGNTAGGLVCEVILPGEGPRARPVTSAATPSSVDAEQPCATPATPG